MNGLEIEIDNPLVPMELMPVKPLDYYNYDFLDPNWKPKSFWGRLLGRKRIHSNYPNERRISVLYDKNMQFI